MLLGGRREQIRYGKRFSNYIVSNIITNIILKLYLYG